MANPGRLCLIAGFLAALLPGAAHAATAPTANNQALSVVTGGERLCALSYSDPDTPAASLTFSIVSPPAHGVLQSYNSRQGTTTNPQYWYYKADGGYVGADGFTWKCFDGTAWSAVATVSVTVTANTVPVAGNSSLNAGSSNRTNCSLPVTDPDAGQQRAFSLVTAPAHGTLESPAGGNWYYTSAKDYVGPDSFQWKVSDGISISNTATVTITVSALIPVPTAQSVGVARNGVLTFPASFTGGGGYTWAVQKVSGPGRGTLGISGATFTYTPPANWMGETSFTWKMTYTNATTPLTSTATVTCTLFVTASGSDWPTFRGNEYRNAITAHQLPASLQLQWVRELPAGRPAWTGGQYQYYNIDAGYEPVVAGQTIFVPSNRNDTLTAYDTVTGAEQWRFFADGPVRMAPLAAQGRVYAASDDGFLYCLNASDGSLAWKRRAVAGSGASALAQKKVLGNGRLISSWPIRGGLMLVDGKLFFSSGLWPSEGTFVGALDAQTGNPLWMWEEGGAQDFVPQGYLVRNIRTPDYFWAPSSKKGAWYFSLAGGSLLADAGALSGPLSPLEKAVPLGAGGYQGGTWAWDCYGVGDRTEFPKTIVAGSKTYTTSALPAPGVSGTVQSMLAANGRLFVVTRGAPARIYCFGGSVVASPKTWSYTETPLPNPNDAWTTRVAGMLAKSGLAGINGVALVLGTGSGRLAEELVRQSSLQVIAIDPSAAKVEALRAKLAAAGLYGARAAVLAADPANCGLQPYFARLIASEDVAAAGFGLGSAFAAKVFRPLRPYEGKAWLFTDAAQHSSFSGWVSSAGLPGAVLARDGEFSVLTRSGKLSGALEFTAANGALNDWDRAIKGPLSVLWYGDLTLLGANIGWRADPGAQADVVEGTIVAKDGKVADAYSGTMLQGSLPWSGVKTFGPLVRPGQAGVTPGFPRRNPLTGLLENQYPTLGGGCPGVHNYGGSLCGADGKRAGIYQHDFGSFLAPMKPSCNGENVIPANGLVSFISLYGCSCQFTPQTSMTLVHDPEGESFANYSNHRLALPIEDDPILKLGVNFGALNDCLGGGKLWSHQPRYALSTWWYTVPFEPASAKRYYHRSLCMESAAGPAWVAASGLKGMTKVRVPVAWPVVAARCGAAPALDGSLADPCWNGDNPVLLTYESVADASGETRQATVHEGRAWLRYDDQALYVCGSVTNPGAKDARFNRSWAVYLTDRRNVASKGPRTYLAFRIAFDGTVSGAKGSLKEAHGNPQVWDSPWTGNWTAAMAWTATSSSAEYAIPWTTLAAEGFDRDTLLFNIVGPQFVSLRPDWISGPEYNGEGRGYGYGPLHFDAAPGLLGNPRPYNVKLHFAETEGALAGQRVFDVKLQGQTVLSNLDIFSVAGGAYRGIVREFPGILVGNELVVEFVAKNGAPAISGIELDGGFALPNHAPLLMTSPGSPYTVLAGGNRWFTVLRQSLDPDGDPLSFAWQFDGQPLTTGIVIPANGDLFTWNYKPLAAAVGEHKLTVTASDGRGGTDSYTWTILVTNDTVNKLPLAVATAAPQVGAAPLAVSFNGSGSSDPDGTIASYAWSFGDGAVASGVGASHTYSTPGTYRAELTVTDNLGAKRCAPVTIYVFGVAGSNRAPLISGYSPGNPATVAAGATQAFNVDAWDPDGDGLAYAWRYDGIISPAAGDTLNYSPAAVEAGNHTIQVTVSDGKGGYASQLWNVTVTAPPTAPSITAQPANRTVTAGQTATFSVTASGTAPLSYQWRKNGVNITGATASNYTTPATTTADNGALFSVVVSNAAGSATSGSAMLTVNPTPANKPPMVSLSAPANGAVYVAPGNVQLSATASDPDGTVAKVQFYSGSTLLGEDLSAPYSLSWNSVGAGTYTVTATAVDNLGLAGASAPVTIKLIPTVTLSYVDAWSSEPGTDSGRFQVSRTSLTSAPLTVFYTIGGTAANGIDYQALSGSLTIPAGSSAASVYVVPLDDTAVEGKETVTFTLAANANYKLGTAIGGTVNLLDNELPVVTMGVRDGWASEPGTDIGQFTLSRTGATAAPLAVKYTLAGTAVNGADYQALGGTATIPAGAASVYVDIVPLSDSLVENIELVSLALQENAAYQTGSALTGTLKILDGDMPILGVAATDASALEPADPGTFTLSRGGNLGVAVTVYYTLGGTALKGADYTAPSGSVTIPAGAASAVVTIAPLDDLLAEGREYASLYLSANAAYQINWLSGARVYLYDDEKPEVRLAVTDSYVSESGPDGGVYTVTCTPPAKGALTVKYAVGGTATAGTDYVALAGSASIPAGGTSATLTVTPKDDAVYEGNETVAVSLLADAAYQALSTNAYTVTLRDDESTVSVSLADASASEPGANPGAFRFSRSGGSNAAALAVTFTVAGTGTSGSDYAALPVTVTIPAGASSIDLPVTPKDDAVAEGPETVVLTLSPHAGYKIGTAVATLTITDND